MLIVEALLKFGAVGIFIALSILILRDGRRIRALRFALPLMFTLTCMVLTTGTDPLRISGQAAMPLRLLDTLTPIFLWWLGLSLFDDEFSLGARESLIALCYLAVGIPVKLYYLGVEALWVSGLDIVSSIIAMGMMLHLVYRAIAGRKEDLVEKRRRVRIWFALSISLALIASILAERSFIAMGLDARSTIWISYLSILPLAIWSIVWLTHLVPGALAFESHSDREERLQVVAPKLKPREVLSHDQLTNLMEQERAFVEHGLTIGKLAKKLALPEHQLRRLINRSMGYQNFASFLNHYRIKDVEAALKDPANQRVPILTLAMNSGFASLAPFNRAFKSILGVTPTEYRTRVFQDIASKSD